MLENVVADMVQAGWFRPWVNELGIKPAIVLLFRENPEQYLVRVTDKIQDGEEFAYIDNFFGRMIPSYVKEGGGPYPGISSTQMVDDDFREEMAEMVMQYLKKCVDQVK